MFGYVKPCVAELKVKEHMAYKAIYCGLCRATGKTRSGCGGGLILASARPALRYDTVFLALFRIALEEKPISLTERRCPLHPLRKRPMADLSDALIYSARVGSLLFAHSLRDRASDEKGLARLGARLLLPYAAGLRRRAVKDLGREADDRMRARLDELSALEASGESSPDRVAAVFGELLGDVFADGLAGDTALHAHALGSALGHWIYLCDAADDLARDRAKGGYNPFLCADAPLPDPEMLRGAMYLRLSDADRALAAIPLNDESCRSILNNILRIGLIEITDRVTGAMRRDSI